MRPWVEDRRSLESIKLIKRLIWVGGIFDINIAVSFLRLLLFS